jgi:hypothetical protein
MSDASYVIRPRFASVAFVFARLFLVTLGVVWLFGAVAIAVGPHPERALEFVGWGGLSVIVASAVLGVVLAVLAIPWQCTLTPKGIVGRSYVGFRRRIAYEDIDFPWVDSSQSFTLLRMSDRVSGKELVMYPYGLDLKEVHAQLVRWAGPDNPLTQAFRTD